MYSIAVIGVILLNFFASAKDVTTPVPYHASVRTDKGHICSGAILSERWIATVAHILIEQHKDAKLHVVVGTNQLNGPGDSYSVSEKFYYPKYNTSVIIKYNMALLKLDKAIRFGSQVKAIHPPKSDTKEGANMVVTGWKTPNDEFRTNNLQEKYVTAINNKKCKRYYGFLNEFNLCSEDKSDFVGDADYFRDAGGPLVENNKLVGILNQFFGNLPALHNRVYKYKSWIKNTMSNNK
ncbi:chymotrypsin-1-like [Pieris brassicae]|uniref:chymotrypsin-1-like n=1 Tax=Pieris brassicae TaxID=7116 RepID=UPI001E6608BF|nr:chymotrypsin-1-like [Pieris brassicae]